jgi:hypothetical protein
MRTPHVFRVTVRAAWPIFAMWLVTMAAAGCEPSPSENLSAAAQAPRTLDRATFEAGLNPHDPRIRAWVAWLKQQGVVLECTNPKENRGEWRVVQPVVSDDYDVVFHIRSFPAWASREQMQAAIADVNLAYLLNAQAHLAMSYAGFRGKRPESKLAQSDDELPQVNHLPLTKAVEQWFMAYEPGKQIQDK